MSSYPCSYEFRKLILGSYSSTRLIDRFHIPIKFQPFQNLKKNTNIYSRESRPIPTDYDPLCAAVTAATVYKTKLVPNCI